LETLWHPQEALHDVPKGTARVTKPVRVPDAFHFGPEDEPPITAVTNGSSTWRSQSTQ
jgi:hypothetical protein